MLDWFFGRDSTPVDLNFLGTDMHAHWLPGIDDGAQDIEQSIAMIRAMRQRGFHRLIATPHIMSDYYRNTPVIIQDRLAVVKSACLKVGLDVELGAAAEYMIDDGFEQHLKQYGALTLPGKRILVEFGFHQPPVDAQGIVFRLQTAGYRPVLAHPERYAYYHNDSSVLDVLVDRGVELQVNLLSLMDHYGKASRQAATDLIGRGKVTFLGTDAHRVEHITKLNDLYRSRKAKQLLRNYDFKNDTLNTV